MQSWNDRRRKSEYIISITMSVDVIVVGASLSGLCSAHLLSEKGLSVMVLEKLNRVGGRILTETLDDGIYLDFGPEFIQEEHKEILELITTLGLLTDSIPSCREGEKEGDGKNFLLQLPGQSDLTYYRKDPSIRDLITFFWNPFTYLELEYRVRQLYRYSNRISIRNPYQTEYALEWDRITFKTFLRRLCHGDSTFRILNSALLTSIGANSFEISALFALTLMKSRSYRHNDNSIFDGCLPHCGTRIRGGSQRLCQELANRVNVVFSQHVTEINQEGNEVIRVKTQNGSSWSCSKVIMGLGSANSIEFYPPSPPTKRRILESSIPGIIVKFYIFYSESHWKTENYDGTFRSLDGIYTGKFKNKVNGVPPVQMLRDAGKNRPCLEGIICGSAAHHWMDLGEKVFEVEVCEYLTTTVFRAEWPRHPVQFHVRTSMRGAALRFYSLGSMDCFYSIGNPFGGIHFSGSETSYRWMGSMNGSVVSGRQSALEIAMELRPESVSSREATKILGPSISRYPFLDGYESEMIPSTQHIFRWTFGLPLLGCALGYAAYVLRDRYWNVLVHM